MNRKASARILPFLIVGLATAIQAPKTWATSNQNPAPLEEDLSIYLRATRDVPAEDRTIREQAESIIGSEKSILGRSRRIHRWVSESIHYDFKALRGYYDATTPEEKAAWENVPIRATEVLFRKSAVCSGYATLIAALHRAIGIPARVVVGLADPYGLRPGQEASASPTAALHAWNEVYVDSRWVILDATWEATGGDPIGRAFGRAARDLRIGGWLGGRLRQPLAWFDLKPDKLARTHRRETVEESY